MENQQISWADYAGLDGFGAGPAYSADQLDALAKALTAGQDINNPGTAAGVGFPLRVESLEKTLKSVTFKMDNLRLFKAIPKMAAMQTVEEHNVIRAYGQQDAGFLAEGALPTADDSTYSRETAVVKYMGTLRSVTHQMSLVKAAHGNVIANEVVNGTMWLLQMLERALFNGDSSLSSLQFDGFETLIKSKSPTSNIVDMRGAPLDESVLIDASQIIADAPNYGTPTHIHMSPKTKSDLIKTFFPKARYELLGQKDGKVGLDINSFSSPAGDVAFESNVFITDGGAPPSTALGVAGTIPSNPTISTGQTSPVDAASQFVAADAGSYWYSISAHNDAGHSAAVDVDPGAIPVAAGDKMTFGVTPAGSPATKWYQLYRSKVGGAKTAQRLIARIPNVSGVGAQTINDYNATLPFCTSAYMWQQNVDAMSWKQLAPMLKVPLAVIDLSVRWAQVIYGTPVMYAPGRFFLFKNVGRTGLAGT